MPLYLWLHVQFKETIPEKLWFLETLSHYGTFCSILGHPDFDSKKKGSDTFHQCFLFTLYKKSEKADKLNSCVESSPPPSKKVCTGQFYRALRDLKCSPNTGWGLAKWGQRSKFSLSFREDKGQNLLKLVCLLQGKFSFRISF